MLFGMYDFGNELYYYRNFLRPHHFLGSLSVRHMQALAVSFHCTTFVFFLYLYSSFFWGFGKIFLDELDGWMDGRAQGLWKDGWQVFFFGFFFFVAERVHTLILLSRFSLLGVMTNRKVQRSDLDDQDRDKNGFMTGTCTRFSFKRYHT